MYNNQFFVYYVMVVKLGEWLEEDMLGEDV